MRILLSAGVAGWFLVPLVVVHFSLLDSIYLIVVMVMFEPIINNRKKRENITEQERKKEKEKRERE